MIAGDNSVRYKLGPSSVQNLSYFEAAIRPTPLQYGLWQWRLVESWTPKRHNSINCAYAPRGQEDPSGFMHKTLLQLQKK